jgi:hypothetical protein
MTYGSEQLDQFTTPITGPITSNTTANNITSTNMQLSAIPKWILIFARESNANLTYASTDTALNISNISITFDNVSGILSTASEEMLYAMSAANGLQDTWEQYHGVTSQLGTNIGTTGSFLKLYFGKDIVLNANSYPGKIGPYNLSFTCSVTNVNQSASIVSPQLYAIISTPQKLIVHTDGVIDSVLGVSGQDGPYMPYDKAMKHYGGSFRDFLNKIADVGKKVFNFVKDNKIVSGIASLIPHPAAQAISGVAQKIGFGDGYGDGYDNGDGYGDGYDNGNGGMSVGGRRRSTRKHVNLRRGRGDGEGGRIASRAELLDRIHQLS